MRTTGVAVLTSVVLLVGGAACSPAGDDAPWPPSTPAPSATSTTAPSATSTPAPSATSAPAQPSAAPGSPTVGHVVAISVDGLNPRAITELGPSGTPTFHRLMRDGACTLDARTEREQTRTLPNHTGMLTSRRIEAGRGGHGVTYNTDSSTRTVHESAGEYVSSVFDVVHDHGGSTALFATKTKFALYRRTWNSNGGRDRVGADDGTEKIDRFVVDTDDARLVAKLNTYLRDRPGEFTFLHIALPDVVGHDEGFMSDRYLTGVRATDELVGTVIDTIAGQPDLQRDTVVLLTADHGGDGLSHSDQTKIANYQIPFCAWGPGVPAGRDLYAMNDTRRTPGTARTTYDGPQPIRNADLGNLATDVLGLPEIPGSELDADHDLVIFGS